MWERSVRQESYDFCVSPSLLSFSHFAPELVGKIFGLSLMNRQGEIGPGNRAHMKTPSNIFELNIVNRIITISIKSKGDQKNNK